MRQIVIISGKGGTGKTVITASFAALAKNKVMADCDVEILGKINFDESIVKAMAKGKTVIEYPDGKAKQEISNLWGRFIMN